MPQPRREQSRDLTAEAASRIVTGPDPDRFYCPHPGCNRSFAELWRLKVHFRAPPDVRGSGKERGHGTELKFCPKCGKELKPGKHHVGCSAGKSAPRQAAKRQRQQSATTDSEWVTPSTSMEDAPSDSWEETMRRQVTKVQGQKSLDGGAEEGGSAATAQQQQAAAGRPQEQRRQQQQQRQQRSAAAGGGAAATVSSGEVACRVERVQQMLTAGDANAELVFTANSMADYGLILRHPGYQTAPAFGSEPALPAAGAAGAARAGSPSPSLARILEGGEHISDNAESLAQLPLLRAPSPPPLPSDWGLGSSGGGGGYHQSLLFDFDQFDANRRGTFGGAPEPFVTVTSAMAPGEMSNPSDDYIWQVMFAGENDVPRRVTAHLHHSAHPAASEEIAKMFDDPDSLLDGLMDGEKVGNGHATDEAANVPQQQMLPAMAAVLAAPMKQESHLGLPEVPAPPAEALQMAAASAGGAPQQPQMVTVTYVVQQGPSGQTQYAVKSVAPGGAAPSGVLDA